jgi:hypothetical protein
MQRQQWRTPGALPWLNHAGLRRPQYAPSGETALAHAPGGPVRATHAHTPEAPLRVSRRTARPTDRTSSHPPGPAWRGAAAARGPRNTADAPTLADSTPTRRGMCADARRRLVAPRPLRMPGSDRP